MQNCAINCYIANISHINCYIASIGLFFTKIYQNKLHTNIPKSIAQFNCSLIAKQATKLAQFFNSWVLHIVAQGIACIGLSIFHYFTQM